MAQPVKHVLPEEYGALLLDHRFVALPDLIGPLFDRMAQAAREAVEQSRLLGYIVAPTLNARQDATVWDVGAPLTHGLQHVGWFLGQSVIVGDIHSYHLWEWEQRFAEWEQRQ